MQTKMFVGTVGLFRAYSRRRKKHRVLVFFVSLFILKDGPMLYNLLGGIEAQGFIA